VDLSIEALVRALAAAALAVRQDGG